MKKITAIIITVLVLCSVLSIACAAYSEDAVDEGTELAGTDAVQDETSGEQIEADAEEHENPFEILFDKVKAHSDTIFSALTLIGSLVLAFTYKKGLLPALGASMGKIGDSVRQISDATEISIKKSEGAIIDIDERIKEIASLFDRLEEQLSYLNDKMEAVEGEKAQNEKTRILMRSQIDMLYDIFMTSSLPQYSKDAVGEKITAMKLLIEEGEK